MEATFRERAKHEATLESIIAELQRQLERQHIAVEQLSEQLSQRIEYYTGEIEQLSDRIRQMDRLLHSRSVQLAEDEKSIVELTDRLRKQLWNTKKLSRLLDNAETAAARLRKSRRWKLANRESQLKQCYLMEKCRSAMITSTKL